MERSKTVTIKNKAVIFLVVMVFISASGSAQTLIYRWRDSDGTVHIVDDLNKVPINYREDVKVYRIQSTREPKESRSKAPPRSVTRVGVGEERSLEGEPREGMVGEIRSTIAGLRERLDELRQEREMKRIRMIRKRAKGNTVVRENREIEEIDREIQVLTDQLGKRTETLQLLEKGKSLPGGQ
jgi:hypothetical protein